MAPNTLSVSTSVLMHACLAYRSPEFQTFDNIIRLHSKNSLLISSASLSPHGPNLGSLPLEVLLAIRTQLLPLLTSHLTALSVSALASYESFLTSLLCPDCQAYSIYVYGAKVWNWPYFQGPCTCPKVGNGLFDLSRKIILVKWLANRLNRIFGTHSTDSRAPYATSSQTAPKLPLFRNPLHWLDAHLTQHVNRIATTSRRIPDPWMRRQKEIGMWDFVSDVLREFECEVSPDGKASFLCHATQGFWDQEVLILPTPSLLGAEDDDDAEAWRDMIIIMRVRRELGLCYESENVGGRRKDSNRPYCRGNCPSSFLFIRN